MSWSMSTPAKTPYSEFKAAMEAATPNGQDDLDPIDDRDVQVRSAKSAAIAVVESGALGDGTITCSIYGHANPAHKPRAGWGNDTVTINLSCGDTVG